MNKNYKRFKFNRYHLGFALMAFGMVMYFMDWSYFVPIRNSDSTLRHVASGWVTGPSVFLLGLAIIVLEEIRKFWNGDKEK